MKNPVNQRIPVYYTGTADESVEIMKERNQCKPAMAPYPYEKGSYLPEVIIRRQHNSTETDVELRIRNVATGAFHTISGEELLHDTDEFDLYAQETTETIDSLPYKVLYLTRGGIIEESDYLDCGVYQYIYQAVIDTQTRYWVSDCWEVKNDEFFEDLTFLTFTCLNSEDPEDTVFAGINFGAYGATAPDTAFSFNGWLTGAMIRLAPQFTEEIEVDDAGKESLVKSTHKKFYNILMPQCPVPLAEMLQACQHYVKRPECEVLVRYRGNGYYLKDFKFTQQAYNGECAPLVTLTVQTDEETVEAGCLDSPANTCPFLPIEIVTPEGSVITTINEYPDNGQVEIECGSASGILYRRPVIAQLDTYANYDIGWYKQNSALDFSEPANPQYIQDLDYDHANWFWMLKHNNAFGNKYRFTNDQGVPATGGKTGFTDGNYTSGGGTMYYVIDHLTGFGYYVPNLGTFGSWSAMLNSIKTSHDSGAHGYTGWMPFYRNQCLGLILSKAPYYTSTNNILRRGVVSGVADTKFMLGETNESNSGNAFYMQDNNTISQAAKSTGGAGYMWRIHY